MIDQILTGLNALTLIIDFEENAIVWSNKLFKQMPVIARKAMMDYIPLVFRNVYSDQPIFKIENNVKILGTQKSDDDSYTTLVKIKSSKNKWNWVLSKSYVKEQKNGKPCKIALISIPVQLTSDIKLLADNKTGKTSQKEPSVLTKKEHIVLIELVDGLTSKEIAEKYYISIHTVQTHRKRILKKLAVKNTAELIRYALKNNLSK
jgi:DNA-binding CsgD family transcriptional regulator